MLVVGMVGGGSRRNGDGGLFSVGVAEFCLV